MNRQRLITSIKYGNTSILIFLAIYFFIVPGIIVIYNLMDPKIKDKGITGAAVRLHHALAPKYDQWARKRIASGKAANMSTGNISGTEWPLFGSVFYLWAIESLQEEWEKDNSLLEIQPKEYARNAIESATQLVIDPNHASWVKKHWGEYYLNRENVFYRMLIIAAVTVYTELTADEQYIDLLRNQVESLSKEIDDSPYGQLNDYPGECYPCNILSAVASIYRADSVLGSDHSMFVKRAIRSFQGKHLDEIGLPPYRTYASGENSIGIARGCSNSFICLFAPEIWPNKAKEWYALYEKFFWQLKWSGAGFREFARYMPGYEWYMDVDSGPVLAGHGIAASAFGVGAARVNGRFDHAFPLTAELSATCWPLADGTLLGPRILSNAADSPYLGEAAILFCLTRQPAGTVSITKGGSIPIFVYILLTCYLGIGASIIYFKIRNIKTWKYKPKHIHTYAGTKFIIWLFLIINGATVSIFFYLPVGIAMLICAQIIPKESKYSSKRFK